MSLPDQIFPLNAKNPKNGGYLGIDELLINDILKKFGDPSLKPFPITDIITYKFIYQIILRMKVHHPLNLVNYSKKEAEHELSAVLLAKIQT